MAFKLAQFHEFSRAIEVLQEIGREVVSDDLLDDIAYVFYDAREIGALRWIIDWVPESVDVSFEMEVLLAVPEERLRLLHEKAREAFEVGRSGDTSLAQLLFCELGHAALLTDTTLGILVARGVLPVCGWGNQSRLMEDIEDAHDILGLDDNEPGYEIMDSTVRASIDKARHTVEIENVRAETASRVGRSNAEIQRLNAQIDSMQETLKEREDAIERANVLPRDQSAAVAPPNEAETRELRDHLRRLKDTRKVEHEELNRAKRELRVASAQLRRATREKPADEEPEKSADPHDDDEAACTDVEWERQTLRIPEYSAAFRESLQNKPRHVAAASLAMAGRLAGGDPSTWKTVRMLKQCHGTLRARVAGDYRLLFRIEPEGTLLFVDFILRRDLERWITADGR